MLSLPVDVLNTVSRDLFFIDLINLYFTHKNLQEVQKELRSRLLEIKVHDGYLFINPLTPLPWLTLGIKYDARDFTEGKILAGICGACETEPQSGGTIQDIKLFYRNSKPDWIRVFLSACKYGNLEIMLGTFDHIKNCGILGYKVLEDVIEFSMNWEQSITGKMIHVVTPKYTIIDRGFRRACENGHISTAEILLPYLRMHHFEKLFIEVCGRGQLDSAKWMRASLNVNVYWNNYLAFQHACLAGKLDVAKWLLELIKEYTGEVPGYPLKSKMDCLHANLDTPLRWACYGEHVNIVEWLTSFTNRVFIIYVKSMNLLETKYFCNREIREYLMPLINNRRVIIQLI